MMLLESRGPSPRRGHYSLRPMSELILKIIGFLIDKYTSVFKYLMLILFACIIFLAAFTYIFWDALVQPRLDYYLMTKFNSYFEGEKGQLAVSARAVQNDIKHAAVEQFKSIWNSLYNDVDAVYPIYNSFSREDFKDVEQGPSFSLYIYADPQKHIVLVSLFRRQNSFDFEFCVNNAAKSCDVKSNNMNVTDVTDLFKKYKLKAANAGLESDVLKYPENIQLITITPQNPNWSRGTAGSLEGYVMVRRARLGF